MAWHLARNMPDRRIINLGVPAWGTDQELADLEAFLRRPDSPTISDIVVVVFENDFSDVQRDFDSYLGRSKPVFSVDHGALLRGRFRLGFMDRMADYSRLAWVARSEAAGFTKPPVIDTDAGAGIVLACFSGFDSWAKHVARVLQLWPIAGLIEIHGQRLRLE